MNTLSINKFRALVATCVFALTTAAPALHAQLNRSGAKVNVPFAFEVDRTHLPAGDYVITKMTDRTFLIRGNSAQALVTVDHKEGNGPTQLGKIVFVRYGDQYFMHELWNQGSSMYESFVESKDESRVRAEIAAVTHKPAAGVEVAVSLAPSR